MIRRHRWVGAGQQPLLAGLVAAALFFGVGVTVVSGSAGSAEAAASSPTTLFVVDTSGSMEGERLDQAKSALTSSVDALEPGQVAGMRTFSGDCGQGGSLVTPLGANNRSRLKSDVAALQAGGGTPTPEALTAAAADLASVKGPKQIVLISDGESGCGDPCAVAADLSKQQGIDFKIHAVGFNAPDSAVEELSCIARQTGGRYFSVNDAQGLSSAIGQVVNGSSDNPCDRIFFIGLRGSGETVDQYWPGTTDRTKTGMGPLLEYVFNSLQKSTGTMESIPQNDQRKYRAVGLNGIQQIPRYVTDLVPSAWSGATLAADQMHAHIKKCKDKARFVLAGYSQGALAIQLAVDRKMTGPDRDKILGVVMFGNPTYTPFVNGAVGPKYTTGLIGPRPSMAGGVPARAQDYCNDLDPICSARAVPGLPPGVRVSAGDLLTCVTKNNLCTHFHYIRTSADRAVAYLAGRIR